MESDDEPGSDDSDNEAKAAASRAGAGWAMALVLVLVGGVGGYLWNALGVWPAGDSGLKPAERTWCGSQADLVALSAYSLDLMSREFLDSTDVGGEDDPVNLSVLFQYQGNINRAQIDPAREAEVAILALQTYVLGQNWIIDKPDGWSDPDVVLACAAAYEAFR